MGTLELFALAYLAIGVWSVLAGRTRQRIRDELRKIVIDAEQSPHSYEIQRTKILAYIAILTLLGAFLWPVFAIDILLDQLRTERFSKKETPGPLARPEHQTEAHYGFEVDQILRQLCPTDEEACSLAHRDPLIDPSDAVRSNWTMVFQTKFKRDLKALDPSLRGRFEIALKDILNDPISAVGNTKKPLEGNHSGLWRYRVGGHRIVYSVDRPSRQVVLIACKERSSVYTRIDA
jgi:mRNA-degrading endonuclease RelE of RelBE toxin-antitoxin system